jgi:nucleotide-binding universal stress UspA family protein
MTHGVAEMIDPRRRRIGIRRHLRLSSELAAFWPHSESCSSNLIALLTETERLMIPEIGHSPRHRDAARRLPLTPGCRDMQGTTTVYRRILVGYDDSKASRKAFGVALDLAATHGADLFIVTVALALDLPDDVETKALVDYSLFRRIAGLDALKPLAAASGVKAHFEILQGRAAEQIVYDAERHGVDLIVVGERQRSRLARLLIGSVSKQVLQRARRPVLVVR